MMGGGKDGELLFMTTRLLRILCVQINKKKKKKNDSRYEGELNVIRKVLSFTC
jgi:hypothetical protein